MLNLLGVTLLLTAISSSLLKRNILKIPPVIFEIIGVPLICFSLGLSRNLVPFGIIVCGCALAVFFDPYIWKKQGNSQIDSETRKFSVLLNTAIGLAGSITFVISYFFL